ncbi:uncharacterized protein LOC124115800 isoform X2 [Haliotis rufescens]|uniref:uncharacterized protein LOC124115800 isoform X2 n=1 Tax=Haliotis rufescens TaxID=6454 RepID=UPI00201F93E5|nr:uncharacterized protein LOC124115800 isoform X2 [Haliotis rufescens]
MYKVVLFTDDDELAVVPSNWLDGKGCCLWPPFKSSTKLTKAVINQEKSSETWRSYQIWLLPGGESDNYERAREKLRLAEDTSDLQTAESEEEEESLRYSKRKKSVFIMCDPDLMEVKRFCEEGEIHFNEGNIKKAIESFQKALGKAKSTEDRHLENVCSYNLASVHAANGDKRKYEQNLKDLSNQFIKDNLPEGERSMTYLQAVADRSPWQYKQALEVTNDSKKQIYLLKQLVKQCKDKQDKDKQIEYLERLQTVYEVQREDIRWLEVACQRARLLYREKTTEALLEVLKKVEKKLGEYDTESLKTNSVPIWNEVGLMYTLLKKEDKALQCFENGLKLIHDKNTASILKTAVLKQNIGAVQYMKHEFALAKKSDEEAIKQYDEYVAERRKSTSNGKRTQNRGTQVYHYDDERMTYWQLKEDNGEGRIYGKTKPLE